MFNRKKPSTLTGAKPAAENPAAAPSKPPKKGFKLPGFGKKKATPPPKPAASEGASPEKPAVSQAPAASARSAAKKGSGGSPLKLLLPIIALVVIGGGAYVAFTRLGGGAVELPSLAPVAEFAAIPTAPADTADSAAPILTAPDDSPAPILSAPTDSATAPTVKPAPKATVNCAGKPKFLKKLGFVGDITFATNEKGIRGLIMFGAPTANSDTPLRYQHQTWSRAGFLDAFVMDRNGNLYLAPSPRTGLGVTEPKNQDQIFKLDTQDGALASYITLPSAAPASPENPYGVLGLAYDCDTNSLYATTVTGSTPAQQVGRIYHIDLNTGEIAGQRDNLDAYGVAVRSAEGKQLIFGSPHDAQIRALDLDEEGNFQGEPRTIATLADPQRAHKISFANENEMIVQAVEFSFTNVDIPQETETRFQYEAAADTWSLAQ
jgi:hypothetical protein